ncbi:hypothetical protein L1987_61163 [Smallanthus sonchifolius]|uniref:Uncharacterized protein n=1 Tax=Smallanthus sonchifolius TaxID=185202 RepID=A0ACB9D9Z8_9ASTR|nr:hypothetical protein L1987_61163 [Smallanthus sonchifolius]
MKNMKSNSILALGFLLFLLIFSHPSSTQAQEVEDEREFDYVRGGPIGPEKWGEIKKEWSLCSYGTMQSPIDMSSQKVDKVVNYDKQYRNYKPSNATLTNRGHDITGSSPPSTCTPAPQRTHGQRLRTLTEQLPYHLQKGKENMQLMSINDVGFVEYKVFKTLPESGKHLKILSVLS